MYTGPHLIKDNLVFGYDTGYGVADNNTATRFYQGESTTNLITTSGLDFTVLSSYGNLSRTQVVDSNSPSGYACEMQVTDGSAINPSARIAFGASTNIPSSGNAMVSVYIKFEGGTSSNISPRVYNGTGTSWQTLSPLDGGSAYLTSEYRRFGYYGSIAANPGFSMTKGNSSIQTGQKTRWHSPQVELTTQATPFTPDSRSSTESLIDLKRATDIDVSNVSFDSTGQPEFDGTDDNINQGDVLDTGLQDFTIETVFKRTTNTSASQWIMSKSYAGAAASRYWVDNFWSSSQSKYKLRFGASWANTSHTNYLSNSFIDIDQWYHVVVVVERNNKVFLHINGVLDASHDISSHVAHNNSSTLPYRIGSYTAGNQVSTLGVFNGSIPVYRHSNRAFTTDEIKQNYRAYKNRFGI